MDDRELDPTVAAPRPDSTRRPGAEARFLPGAILDRRYRIVAPLGRGGMGEVFRADDLKLGQTVALKFLPRALEQDPGRLALLLDEVKLARQVSHPNVCRVWDAGDAGGLPYIAMEFVDGEDLAALLRRIGRLPEDRALQVAREICAGLAAIHDQGLLHRDLKPANLMLDGRGRVRITDFGLATIAEVADRDDVRSGTPAYMAPEQLEGREVTARSDVYALGLVLYELFTGRPAFAPARDRAASSRPESPASHVRALDPVIERAILRCLEPDPAARPASALAVARALPGGDPLEAARVAGETPSPEMVAAAGGVGGLRPLVAVGLAGWVVLGTLGILALADRRGLPFGPEDKPYVALRDRAGELVRALGVAAPGDWEVDGYEQSAGAGTPGDRGAASARGTYYWNRRSPFAIPPVLGERDAIYAFDAPGLDPGAVASRWDLRGRLLELRRIPRLGEPPADSVDWGPCFAAARLAEFPRTPAAPEAPPPAPAGERRAWIVASAEGPVRVEAAAFRGRPTFFATGPPHAPAPVTRAAALASTMQTIVLLALFATAALIARRNLRIGRADVRGAARVSIVMAPLGLLGFGFFAHPQPAWGQALGLGVASTVFYTAFYAVSYIALEPVVRRGRPEWLTSWTRLVAGRWRDPLVGRDVLVGLAAGVALGVASGLRGLLLDAPPFGDFQAAAIGGRLAVAVVLRGFAIGALTAVVWSLLLVLVQAAVRGERRDLLVNLIWGVLAVGSSVLLGSGPMPLRVAHAALTAMVWLATLRRAGLLGVAVAFSLYGIFNEEYLTTNLGAWYSGVAIAGVATVAALLAWSLLAIRRAPASDPAV